MSHVTRTPLSGSKGQLVADVLNNQHAGTGAAWRINAKILSTFRGRRHIVAAAHLQLVCIFLEAKWRFAWVIEFD